VLFVVISFAVIVLIDFIPIIKARSRRTTVAFLIVFIPALTVSVLIALKVRVPSILLVLDKAFKSIGISYGSS
jgi:hypothetical protein